MYQCTGTDKARKQNKDKKTRLGSVLWEISINLGLTYKVVKVTHLKKYTYIYELPLKNYAVVQYGEDDETMEFSQFFFDYADALHCFNEIKE